MKRGADMKHENVEAVVIRTAEKEDFPAILKLNEAEVEKTSPMDLAKITLLACNFTQSAPQKWVLNY